MTLRIHNSLTRETEEFVPIEPGHVRMYVCGMTIYDLCHVGHARMMMSFDVVQRWLKVSGLRVTYVRNITDIDDKIIKRAVENGMKPSAELTEPLHRGDEPRHAAALGVAAHRPTSRARQTMCRRCWPSSSRLEKKRARVQAP